MDFVFLCPEDESKASSIIFSDSRVITVLFGVAARRLEDEMEVINVWKAGFG